MLFLFKSDNSADLLWNVEGASGTLHIANIHKFLNHLEIARTCYNMRQELDAQGYGHDDTCTSDDPANHQGDTCSVHETRTEPTYFR